MARAVKKTARIAFRIALFMSFTFPVSLAVALIPIVEVRRYRQTENMPAAHDAYSR